jgi:hypothetical protein
LIVADDSLSTLHCVGDKLLQLDDYILVELLVVDEVIELGSKHRLNKVDSIGENDSDQARQLPPFLVLLSY